MYIKYCFAWLKNCVLSICLYHIVCILWDGKERALQIRD